MTQVRLRVPLATIVLGVLALYVFAQRQQSQGAESGSVFDAAAHELHMHKAWEARSAKLAAIAQAAAQNGRRWKAKAEVAAPAAAQLDATLAAATTMRDSNGVLVHQVEFYRGQSLAWEESSHAFERAWLADSTRAGAAEARVTELEQHLAQVLTVADCHILGAKFLPRCPGRTTAFVVGAAGTAVAFIATRH